MRRLLTAVLGLIGLGGSGVTMAQQPTTIDPASILFSMPTINDELGSLESVGVLSGAEAVMHEDDWRQLEFYPAARSGDIRKVLSELKSFEQAHRKASGWDAIYVRKIAPALVLAGDKALQVLSQDVGAKPSGAPVLLHGSNAITGRIANGFSLHVSDGLFLYGVSGSNGISVLAASVDGGDLALTKIFAELARRHSLILVDWRGQMIVEGVASNGNLMVWKP